MLLLLHICCRTCPPAEPGEQGPVHTAWGSAHNPAARGSTPARYSSQTLLSLSPRFMTEGDAAETTRWRFPGGPCHHRRAQGLPLTRLGGHPPLPDQNLTKNTKNPKTKTCLGNMTASSVSKFHTARPHFCRKRPYSN